MDHWYTSDDDEHTTAMALQLNWTANCWPNDWYARDLPGYRSAVDTTNFAACSDVRLLWFLQYWQHLLPSRRRVNKHPPECSWIVRYDVKDERKPYILYVVDPNASGSYFLACLIHVHRRPKRCLQWQRWQSFGTNNSFYHLYSIFVLAGYIDYFVSYQHGLLNTNGMAWELRRHRPG